MTLQPHSRLSHPTQRQGFITDISWDTIAYAMQASEGATVVIEQGTKVADGQVLIMEDVRFRVELSSQNYSGVEEKLSVILLEESVCVLQAYGISACWGHWREGREVMSTWTEGWSHWREGREVMGTWTDDIVG